MVTPPMHVPPFKQRSALIPVHSTVDPYRVELLVDNSAALVIEGTVEEITVDDAAVDEQMTSRTPNLQ